LKYFGYGSNLDKDDLNNWCKRKGYTPLNLKFLQVLKLDSYKLDFTTYSPTRESQVADIVWSPGSFCYGAVFDITDKEKEILDEKEGAPSFYKELSLPDGIFTYEVVNKKQSTLPEDSYLDLIIQGAKNYGLPGIWIDLLESFRK